MSRREAARYLVPLTLLVTALACGGVAGVTQEQNVRITGMPQFVCPSSTPRPTATQRATAVQPDRYIPPSGWATNTPYPGGRYVYGCRYIYSGYSCGNDYATMTPYPGGNYTNPGYTVPGATSTPRPTHTPWPSPTPYVVFEEYPIGADVFVGERNAMALRLRVRRIRVTQISDTEQVVRWEVRVRNIGNLTYNTLPGAQTFVSEVGGTPGYWYASANAALLAGLTPDEDAMDIAELAPGQRINLTLAAITPVGDVGAIAWILDPYSGGIGQGVVGGNTAIWRNRRDLEGCEGNVEDLDDLPTRNPGLLTPTPTPSPTPWIPPYAGATRPPL